MVSIEERVVVIGLKRSDVNKDILILFAICYEYQLSFTNIVKLFSISKKYFWTFLEIFSPMIKMGVRKAAMLKKSVDKMMECLQTKNWDSLNPREERMLEAFTWFIEDNFTDGEGCLHVSQFDNLPFVKAYAENNLVINSKLSVSDNVDRIKYIEMGDEKFYKTSRFLYFMEKYSGDTDMRELDSLSVKEMMRRINLGVEKLHEKEKSDYYKVKQRI